MQKYKQILFSRFPRITSTEVRKDDVLLLIDATNVESLERVQCIDNGVMYLSDHNDDQINEDYSSLMSELDEDYPVIYLVNRI